VRELIEHGVDGYNVPRDPRAIRDLLQRLVDRPGERAAVGAAGRESERRLASWAVATRTHLDLFDELFASQAGGA
jgi:glycosyltransferase involved in cell wall biosynthesis